MLHLWGITADLVNHLSAFDSAAQTRDNTLTIPREANMRIGFISKRLASTDGVSLETAKWARVLQRMGHTCAYLAGELSPEFQPGRVVPEMHLHYPVARATAQRAFEGEAADPELDAQIEAQAAPLREAIRRFLRDFDIGLVIVENALAIPMNLPLGLALTDVLEEMGLPAIGHHHDFYWERPRYQRTRVRDLLDRCFPPDLPNMRHVVINSLAQDALRRRRGIESVVIPNVFDFAMPPSGIDEYSADFRQAIGLSSDDILILQPTRVIPRKGIELAMELVARLDDPRCKLVVTHLPGDEGMDYFHRLQAEAARLQIDVRWAFDRVGSQRDWRDGRKVYALWDVYPHADFVTYPSYIEGFGNALLEAVYFRRLLLVNRYPVYVADIAPKGFRFVEIDGVITDAAVAQVRELLADPVRREAMVAHNYEVARRHFSFETLEALLGEVLKDLIPK